MEDREGVVEGETEGVAEGVRVPLGVTDREVVVEGVDDLDGVPVGVEEGVLEGVALPEGVGVAEAVGEPESVEEREVEAVQGPTPPPPPLNATPWNTMVEVSKGRYWPRQAPEVAENCSTPTVLPTARNWPSGDTATSENPRVVQEGGCAKEV